MPLPYRRVQCRNLQPACCPHTVGPTSARTRMEAGRRGPNADEKVSPMRMGRSVQILAVGFALTFVVACGGSGSGSGAKTSPDAANVATQISGVTQGTAASALATASALVSKQSNQNGAARVDACSLLTPDEVGAAVGMPASVDPGHSNVSECEWAVGDPELGKTVTLSLVSQSEYDIFKGQSPVAVSGLGDEAYWGMVYVLGVRSGNRAFHIQIVTFQDDAVVRQAAQDLAAKVLQRL